MHPAELAALEHAFAKDPNSDAYRPLTEAYLAMGRFMEAMVVCKKGVKAHPDDSAPRVLLARIYAAQGKDRKALDELAAALATRPADAAANRMAGLLQLKLGEKDLGIAALRKAWESAPDDAETLEAMKTWGLSFAAPAPPPPPPAAESATPTIAPTVHSPSPSPREREPGPASAPASAEEVQVAPSVAAPQEEPSRGTAATPQPGPAPARNTAYSEELASRYGTKEYTLEHPVGGGRRKHHRALVATAALGVVFAAVLGAWFAVSSMRKARAVEIDRLLRQTRELLEKDSYASYKEAAKLCERILDRDPDSLGGHAYLAYIDAIRWGEHGESEGLRDDARKHLEAVTRGGRGHSHAYAATAYLAFHGGDASGAIAALKKVMAGPEGASSLLHGVLGVLEMQSGDLDGARQDLTMARQNAPGDVRITQMLAEQWRRRGQGYEVQASALYDTALTRLAPDHVPSLLGKAQLLLEGGRPDEASKRIARVLEMGPGASPRQVAVAHALRGSVLHAQGKKEEGDAAEQQALALDPSNGEIHDLVGRRKLRGGDVNGAVESLQKAIHLDRARLSYYVDLANALMQRPGSGARQAVAALEKASERVANARVTKLLGDAYRTDGDLERARAAYERAIGQEKRYPEARVALARVYRDRKDYGKALEELDRAAKEFAETTTGGASLAYVEIAYTEEARGAPVDAVERAYTSALKADAQSCPALFWLGRSRSVKKSRGYDRALSAQMLNDYLKVCPKGPHAAEAQQILAGLR
jgi:tetratricopeptide (TPR) repeat protein